LPSLEGLRTIRLLMHNRLILQRSAPQDGRSVLSREGRAAPSGAGPEAFSREGRDSEASRRATALVLLSRQGLVPAGWLLLLGACCTYVAVRALHLL